MHLSKTVCSGLFSASAPFTALLFLVVEVQLRAYSYNRSLISALDPASFSEYLFLAAAGCPFLCLFTPFLRPLRLLHLRQLTS